VTADLGRLLAPAGTRGEIDRLAEAIGAGARCSLTGLSGSSRALHLLLLLRSLNRSILLVTAGDADT
jgi:hypothetical protein